MYVDKRWRDEINWYTYGTGGRKMKVVLEQQHTKTVLMIPLVTMIITDQFSGTEIKIRLIMKMRMELHIVNVIQNMV